MASTSRIRLPETPLRPDVADRPVVVGRGREVADRLAGVIADLEDLAGMFHEFGDEDLAQVTGSLLRLRLRAEGAVVSAATEAAERGTVLVSDAANTTQWVSDCARSAGVPIDTRDANTIAQVGEACRERTHRVVRDAVRRGRCTVSVAKAAVQQAAKIQPSIPTADREEILGWYLALDPSLGIRGQRQLTRRILATYSPDRLDRDDGALERTQTMSWTVLENGLTRITADLAPVNAAIFSDAITAHSAPRPAMPPSPHDEGANGGVRVIRTDGLMRDQRTPGQRRAEALITLIHAGSRVGEADGTQVGSGARVMVTIPLITLTDQLGAATTLTGDVLDPTAARRLACDSDLIPAVLGSQNEPLDVGRSKRLVTGGLRAAVMLRDRGCTFPGCDRPPPFCEVHHIRHWADGGTTSLANSAMLCTTHHQTVHRHDYTATVDPGGVSWTIDRSAPASAARTGSD